MSIEHLYTLARDFPHCIAHTWAYCNFVSVWTGGLPPRKGCSELKPALIDYCLEERGEISMMRLWRVIQIWIGDRERSRLYNGPLPTKAYISRKS